MRIIKYVVFTYKKKRKYKPGGNGKLRYIYTIRVIMIKECSVLENLMH